MNRIKFINFLIIGILSIISVNTFAQLTLNTPNVNSVLYVGKSKNQPLVVGLGGSEGGNAWTSNRWKPIRDQFLEKGYAFLAIGYFGASGTPDTLERIAIEPIHDAILEATKNPQVSKTRIAIVGGSRGADLALLISSYYSDINCVVGIVPSHVVFPGNTNHFTTSTWTYQGKELPFVPVNEAAVPFLIKRDLRGTFEAMLRDSVAEEKARIHVENIKGSILLLSATKDEIIPSTPMCEKIISRLRSKNFSYVNEHVAIEGSHAEPLKHFDKIFEFLDRNFLKNEH
ncbi:hypothetical protein GCM10028807_11950 [Spirosoma daeguense]